MKRKKRKGTKKKYYFSEYNVMASSLTEARRLAKLKK